MLLAIWTNAKVDKSVVTGDWRSFSWTINLLNRQMPDILLFQFVSEDVLLVPVFFLYPCKCICSVIGS